MKVIEERFRNDINLCFGLYNLNDLIRNEYVRQYAKGMTLFYINRVIEITETKKMEIFEGDSINQILDEATDAGFDYILIQSVGNLLYKSSIIFDIENFIKNNEFGFAGHILNWSEDKYYEIHPQFFIINLKAYLHSGKPYFGYWESGEDLLADVERSVENFHDHYTPLWIKYKGTKSLQKHTQRGWSMVSSLLENGYNVITLPQKIREKKLNLYFEAESNEFIKAMKTLNPELIKNPNQKRLVYHNLNMLNNIWLFNSEDMYINNDGTFDVMAFPASGLKFLSVIKQNKLNKNGKLIIYDFNENSIEWIKFLKNYKNENLIECISEFPNNIYFKWLGNTAYAKFIIDDGFNTNYSNSMNFFGGEDEFKKLWVEFKKMNVEFINTNIIEDRERLVKNFYGFNGKKYIHISNIFSNDLTIALYGLRDLYSKLNDFLLECYLIDINFEVSMFDFINRFRYGKIREILGI